MPVPSIRPSFPTSVPLVWYARRVHVGGTRRQSAHRCASERTTKFRVGVVAYQQRRLSVLIPRVDYSIQRVVLITARRATNFINHQKRNTAVHPDYILARVLRAECVRRMQPRAYGIAHLVSP